MSDGGGEISCLAPAVTADRNVRLRGFIDFDKSGGAGVDAADRVCVTICAAAHLRDQAPHARACASGIRWRRLSRATRRTPIPRCRWARGPRTPRCQKCAKAVRAVARLMIAALRRRRFLRRGHDRDMTAAALSAATTKRKPALATPHPRGRRAGSRLTPARPRLAAKFGATPYVHVERRPWRAKSRAGTPAPARPRWHRHRAVHRRRHSAAGAGFPKRSATCAHNDDPKWTSTSPCDLVLSAVAESKPAPSTDEMHSSA